MAVQVGIGLFTAQVPPGSGRSFVQEYREIVDLARLAETLGFDSAWVSEHHGSGDGYMPSLLPTLAAMAAATDRIKLGTGVVLTPFHHPLRLAEETATLDILSRGRLVVGLGRGNRPLEFLGHGVPQDESRSRMEEGVEVLRRAWTEERVTFHGRHWQIDDIPVYPKPVSRPHPPLAFAVTSPESLRWAGSNGFAILSSGLFTPLDALL